MCQLQQWMQRSHCHVEKASRYQFSQGFSLMVYNFKYKIPRNQMLSSFSRININVQFILCNMKSSHLSVHRVRFGVVFVSQVTYFVHSIKAETIQPPLQIKVQCRSMAQSSDSSVKNASQSGVSLLEHLHQQIKKLLVLLMFILLARESILAKAWFQYP